MAANQSYLDDGGFQTNPVGSNTQNRSFLSTGAFQPQRQTSITATAAWTEAQDAFAATAQTGVFVAGAWTEGQDAIAASATVSGGGVTADAAWTEGQDAVAGVATTGVFAAGAWVEGQDAVAGVATTGVFASGAWTEGQDAIVGSATISLPTVTCDVAWTEGQDGWRGDATNGNADTHDPGITDAERKRLKKREQKRQQKFAAERDKRQERRGKVIDAFERVIEGKPDIPAVFVDSVVEVLEEVAARRDIEGELQQLLDNTVTLQRLWDEFIERDDEEVLALL